MLSIPVQISTRHGRFLLVCALTTAFVGSSFAPTRAGADTDVPWECSNYNGEAQARCIKGLIEEQQKKIGALEGQLQSQQSQMKTLQDQIDRQSRAATQPPVVQSSPPPVVPYVYAYPPYGYPYGYPYAYAYPPGLGLGLYFGGPRYWGPGYYGHWGHHRWRR
jgi:hypothetical protein